MENKQILKNKNLIEIVSEELKKETHIQCLRLNEEHLYDYRCKFIEYCTQIYTNEENFIIEKYSEVFPGLKLNYPNNNHTDMLVHIGQILNKLVEVSKGDVVATPGIKKDELGLLGKYIFYLNSDEQFKNERSGPKVILNQKGIKILNNWMQYLNE